MSALRVEDAARILGVSPDDDLETIKAAYRRLALKWHPEWSRQPEAKERFQEVSVAYTRLVSRNIGVIGDDGDADALKCYGDVDEMRAFMNMFMDLVGVFGDARNVDGPVPASFCPGELSEDEIHDMSSRMVFSMMFGGAADPDQWFGDDDPDDMDDEDDDDDDEDDDDDDEELDDDDDEDEDDDDDDSESDLLEPLTGQGGLAPQLHTTMEEQCPGSSTQETSKTSSKKTTQKAAMRTTLASKDSGAGEVTTPGEHGSKKAEARTDKKKRAKDKRNQEEKKRAEHDQMKQREESQKGDKRLTKKQRRRKEVKAK
eukprot:scaffold1541_cov256-Pinguiococcus_pyrenoidosus.AAC.28